MVNDSYMQLSVRVTLDWEDIWIEHCFEFGASGVEVVEEAQKYNILRIFFTDVSISASKVYSIFFKKYDVQKNDLIWIKHEEIKNKDWLLEWKRFFHPTNIGKQFIICPPWEIPEKKDAFHNIIIEPGYGFGSGSHPSTVIALEMLETYVQEMERKLESILDVGTGSGILLIASKYLGLTKLLGVDIDLPSIYDAEKNFKINNIGNNILTVCSGPECINYKFDIVVSNMMLHELEVVKESLAKNVKNNGVLILSGFYKSQKERIKSYFKEFETLFEISSDEWCGIVISKKLFN